MRIELNCRECGRNHFSLDGNPDDSARITCKDCGHDIGTMGELKQLIAAEVLRRAGDARDGPRPERSL